MRGTERESLFSVVRFYTFPTIRRTHCFIDQEARDEILKLFQEACFTNGFELLASGIVSDHVHLLIRHGALCQPAEVMWLLKGRVSHEFFRRYPGARFDLRGRLWARGYHSKRISSSQIGVYTQYCQGQYETDGQDKRWT